MLDSFFHCSNKNAKLKKFLAKLFFKIIGWKMGHADTQSARHSVMLAAPHTSNWDLPIALAAFWIMGLNLRYLIKSEYTRGPFGWFFKWTGAIGVDRSKARNNLTEVAIDLLKNYEMVLMVPAEGTRKRVEKWRTGFYRIANEAKVPISLGTLDYENKVASVIDVFHPTGEFEKDMEYIQEQYRNISGKYPENYNPQIY